MFFFHDALICSSKYVYCIIKVQGLLTCLVLHFSYPVVLSTVPNFSSDCREDLDRLGFDLIFELIDVVEQLFIFLVVEFDVFDASFVVLMSRRFDGI